MRTPEEGTNNFYPIMSFKKPESWKTINKLSHRTFYAENWLNDKFKIEWLSKTDYKPQRLSTLCQATF